MHRSTSPLVSVVIPLYNKEQHIKKTIDCVLSQSTNDYEIIIVNDGSTDASVDTVRGIRCEKIKIINQENMGPGSARNTGIKYANGKYIAFLDADDIWYPDYLSTCIAELERNTSCDYCVSKHYYGTNNVVRESIYSDLKQGANHVKANWTGKRLRKYLAAHHTSAVIVKKTIIDKIGGFYDRTKCLFGEDHYLFMKLALTSSCVFIEAPLCQYSIENSDLNRQDIGPLPPEPAILDPDPIKEICPEHIKLLLKKNLYYTAMLAAKRYQSYGLHIESKKILKMYPLLHNIGILELLQRLYVYLPTKRQLRLK